MFTRGIIVTDIMKNIPFQFEFFTQQFQQQQSTSGCSSVTSEYFFNQQRWLHGARAERLVTKFVDTKTPTTKVFFQFKD
jgi:hypothetical protein